MSNELAYNINHPKKFSSKSKIIIMLHGYGSNKEDLFSFSDYMNPNDLIISIQGPNKIDYGSYCWWTINFDESMNLSMNISEAKESIESLHNFISVYLSESYKFNFENILLLGFSQGAMIAYALSINYPRFYKKVVGLSGKIPKEILQYKEKEYYLDHNFFCSHGIYDQVIKINAGRESSNWLLKKEIKHIFLEFESQHNVSPENFEKMKSWIYDN